MALTLQTVEALAPDQASLKAASGLLKPAKWALRGADPASRLIWGECQGSGANPYRVMADVGDHGHKCTCPSRKLPCKHVLALMWAFAEQPGAFAAGEAPDWVRDWVGRRRKTGGAPADAKSAGGKSLAEAARAAPALDPAEEAEKEAKRKAAAERRAADTARSVAQGLVELEQWIADQLRLGLSGLLSELPERCRRIAARLVDAKAGALAGRLDELPARILASPSEERGHALIAELSRIVLLARAFAAQPHDPELARAVVAGETRESVLSDPEALRAPSVWEVLAERVETRRDGLVAQSTWLLNLVPQNGSPRFALLVDYFPASAGRRGGAFTPGEQLIAELCYYRARTPLRAIVAQREASEDRALAPWPAAPDDPLTEWRERARAAPWRQAWPMLLPRGRLCEGAGGRLWWRARAGDMALPVSGTAPAVALGTDLDTLAAVWDGARLSLLAAETREWGRIAFDD